MQPPVGEKYRNLKVVQGGQYAKRPGRPTWVMSSGEWVADREFRTAFTEIKGADGNVPSEAIYDIRRGRQHPWRVLIRRFIEAKEAGTPREQLERVADVLKWWVNSTLYREHRKPAA